MAGKFGDVQWITMKISLSSVRTGSGLLTQQSGWSHLSTGHTIDGIVDKDNRDKTKHEFCCKQCSYTSNDDRTAAMNIQFLGTLYNSGIDKPHFEKLELIQ